MLVLLSKELCTASGRWFSGPGWRGTKQRMLVRSDPGMGTRARPGERATDLGTTTSTDIMTEVTKEDADRGS